MKDKQTQVEPQAEAAVEQPQQTVEETAAAEAPMPEPKRNRKKLIVIIVIILLVLLVAIRAIGSFSKPEISESTPINVKTTEAAVDSIYATSPVSGRIKPIQEVAIVPLASGEITGVYVELGQEVKKGTVLFEIDKTQMSTTYNQAKDAYNVAKTNYDRMNLLYQEGAVSLQTYEQAQMQYNTAKETYRSASDAYNNCTVTSPIDGFVTALNVSVGNIASSAGGPSAVVADVSSLEIDATVSDEIVGKIKVGDKVELYISSLGTEPYEGTITALSPAPSTGSLAYPIKISVTDKNQQIMAGMFAEVRVKSDMKENVLCIPSDAVFIKGGRSIVVKLEKDLPSYVEVETGLDNGEFVEILSGIKAGDVIVTSGQQYVTEGVAVNILAE